MQIILNAFRQKPLEQVLPAAAEAGVGIIARVPLASGLLSGRYTEDTTFAADDHRTYNRARRGLRRRRDVRRRRLRDRRRRRAGVRGSRRDGVTPAQLALRWIIDQPGVTDGDPGRPQRVEQARGNAAAATSIAPLGETLHAASANSTTRRSAPPVHDRW